MIVAAIPYSVAGMAGHEGLTLTSEATGLTAIIQYGRCSVGVDIRLCVCGCMQQMAGAVVLGAFTVLLWQHMDLHTLQVGR